MNAPLQAISPSPDATAGAVGETQLPSFPRVRASGILVEGGLVLIECQRYDATHWHWSFPGGKLERGETLADCLRREFLEETGVPIEVGDLLYVCDRFRSRGAQMLDVSFAVSRLGGGVQPPTREDRRASGVGETGDARTTDGIVDVRMVPASQLKSYGFSHRVVDLIERGFPERGSYQGEFHSFYDDETESDDDAGAVGGDGGAGNSDAVGSNSSAEDGGEAGSDGDAGSGFCGG